MLSLPCSNALTGQRENKTTQTRNDTDEKLQPLKDVTNFNAHRLKSSTHLSQTGLPLGGWLASPHRSKGLCLLQRFSVTEIHTVSETEGDLLWSAVSLPIPIFLSLTASHLGRPPVGVSLPFGGEPHSHPQRCGPQLYSQRRTKLHPKRNS